MGRLKGVRFAENHFVVKPHGQNETKTFVQRRAKLSSHDPHERNS
jgi:hypothetical protein